MKDYLKEHVLTEAEQKALYDATKQLDDAVDNFSFEIRGYVDEEGRTCVPAEDFYDSDWPVIEEDNL
mgnify:CR=1 FL=1